MSSRAGHPVVSGMSRTASVVVTALLVAAMLGVSGHSVAQDVSARERQAASEAYDRGTAAYLARNYSEAARWFETAHRLAPAAAALVQAFRAAQRAGDDLRVASLGLRLQALYPSDRAAQRAAAESVRSARRFVRVDVRCGGCTLAVDGAVLEHGSFFVEPDVDHRVEASFDTGSLSETVRGAAGETLTLELEPPAPPVVEPEPVEEGSSRGETTPLEPITAQSPPSDGLAIVPWPVTVAALSLTGALGALLVWSGLDALAGVPAYEANPSALALADGQSREARTNWLIAGTLVAAAASAVLAVLTRWNESPEGSDLALDLGVQGDGALLGLRGRF